MPWPEAAPAPYAHLVAHAGPPEPRGLIADVVLDGAGLYLAASTPNLAIRVRLARAVVPDLPVVPMGATLTQGPIDASIWDALVQRARAAMPDEVLLAIIAREPADGELFVAAAGPYTLVEPQLDETGTGDWQATAGIRVRRARDTHPRRGCRSALPPRHASLLLGDRRPGRDGAPCVRRHRSAGQRAARDRLARGHRLQTPRGRASAIRPGIRG